MQHIFLQFVGQEDGSSDDEGMLCECLFSSLSDSFNCSLIGIIDVCVEYMHNEIFNSFLIYGYYLGSAKHGTSK